MTIVAVNGGGNTPQGYQLERCFVKSWGTSGDADDTNDSFNFTDYKPTESVKADDNFSIIDDGRTFDDLAVDPTNPNVDLRPMETPGPDDNVDLPAVQTADTGGGVRSDEGPEEDVASITGKCCPQSTTTVCCCPLSKTTADPPIPGPLTCSSVTVPPAQRTLRPSRR